jgi:hypothetical protein
MADKGTLLKRRAKLLSSQPTMLDVLEDNEQHGVLFNQYRTELANYAYGRQGIRAGSKSALGQLRMTRKQDLASSAAAANERGVLGSSQDFTARQDIKERATLEAQGIRADRTTQLMDNWNQVIQSRYRYELGVLGLAQQQAARRMSGNVLQLVEDAILDSAGGGNGGNGGGNDGGFTGKSGSMKEAVMTAKSFPELLRNLEAVGFRIGETGVGGFDQVDPGAHAAGGRHYTAPKKVADINYGAGGASAIERRKLAHLGRLLVKAGIPIDQWFFPGNDPEGHGDHGHLAVLKRRWAEYRKGTQAEQDRGENKGWV